MNDTLDYLYVDKKFRLPEGETAYQGDSIKIDSTVKIWYVGKFLDGFVFDTNIDSIKRRAFGKVESTGEALDFTGRYCTAYSNNVVIFSPTTLPILPIIK